MVTFYIDDTHIIHNKQLTHTKTETCQTVCKNVHRNSTHIIHGKDKMCVKTCFKTYVKTYIKRAYKRHTYHT